MKKELGIFTLLATLCVVTACLNPRFLSQTNLTNMANVIGSLLMDSVSYHGTWAKFFRDLSLVGTPLAVLVNLAILVFS